MPTHRISGGGAAVIAVLAGSFLTQCDGVDPKPVSIAEIAAGDNQEAVVGTAVRTPPAVRVIRDGSPRPGVTVSFNVSGGGGAVTGASPVTDERGLATVAGWTLGTTVGRNTLTAVPQIDRDTSLTFSATGLRGPDEHLAFVVQPPPAATAGIAIAPPPQVEVRDRYGNHATGSAAAITISLATGPSNAALGGTRTTTASNGRASFPSLILNTAATGYTFRASSAGLTGATSSSFSVTAAMPKVASAVAGDEQTGAAGRALPLAPAVAVRDEYGNGVPGVPVTFAVVSGGGTIAGGNTTTNADGVATSGSWTLGITAGPNSLRASAGVPGSALQVIFTATGTPGTVGSVMISPRIANILHGDVRSFTVTLRDTFGNIASGRAIAWTSRNPAVVTVSDEGLAQGVAPGSTTIAVASEGKSDSAAVTVIAKCPGGFVGDGAAPPRVEISSGVRLGDSVIYGSAASVDAAKTHVVLWALTDRWYVQPFVDSPFTTICSDGSWTGKTHSWKRMVALLVDSTYVPDAGRFDHPMHDPGVLAWAQVPAPRPDVPFLFSNRKWGIKVAEDPFDPGPNAFSDSPANVWVDGSGLLHLSVTVQNGRWTSSEVHLLESLGYGEYTVQLASRVDSLDAWAIFSPFLYEIVNREIDIEFSRALPTVTSPNNAQFIVQPYSRLGNVNVFRMPSTPTSTHRIVWRGARIEFMSWAGWDSYPPDPARVIASWVYTGRDIPPPGAERFRMNLWQFEGRAPAAGKGDEVIVRSFEYRP